MKNRIHSLADLPGALSQPATPPQGEGRNVLTATETTLKIEALRLTRSTAGFTIRGTLDIKHLRVEGRTNGLESLEFKATRIEVTGWGFTVGKALNALFRDAIKFVPRGVRVEYPAKAAASELLANCS